jgi:hypothetical protein
VPDWLARILRTIVQLVAGGTLMGLFLQWQHDADPGIAPYIALVATLLVTIAQNICEQMGWIPTLLKPSDAKTDSVAS